MKNKPFIPDECHMKAALDLAKKSRPSPNPAVGAVIVSEGKIIGRGFHERPGAPHAEINAIMEAKDAARGADLYVTLEPCCHQGKTGPCAEAILEAGIARVAIGMVDPDKLVNGKGISFLKNSQIDVEVGVLKNECEELLSGYTTQRTLGRPMITLKAAITMDGMAATLARDSKWISSMASRKAAHKLRSESDAVLVGVETVVHDNPELTVRHCEGISPLRIVVDSGLRTPIDSKLISSAKTTPTLIAYSMVGDNKANEINKIEGVKTLACKPTADGLVDLLDLAKKLGDRGILSVLVEGGSKIHGSFAAQGLADRVALFMAPKIFGSGIPWISFSGVKNVDDVLGLFDIDAQPVGDDLLIRAKLAHRQLNP